MLGEEIIFNFDNLIFLVISIGSWGFVLVRGMSILKRKNKTPKEVFLPIPLSHTQAVLLAAVARSHSRS